MGDVRTLVTGNLASGISGAQLSTALGISCGRLRQILTTTQRPPKSTIATDQVLRLHHDVLMAGVRPG